MMNMLFTACGEMPLSASASHTLLHETPQSISIPPSGLPKKCAVALTGREERINSRQVFKSFPISGTFPAPPYQFYHNPRRLSSAQNRFFDKIFIKNSYIFRGATVIARSTERRENKKRGMQRRASRCRGVEGARSPNRRRPQTAKSLP